MKVLLLGLPLLLAHTNVTIAKSTLNDIARGQNVSESLVLSPNIESTARILKQDTTSRTSNQAENAEERSPVTSIKKLTSKVAHRVKIETDRTQLFLGTTPDELFMKLSKTDKEKLFKSPSFRAWFQAVQKKYGQAAGDHIIEVWLRQIVEGENPQRVVRLALKLYGAKNVTPPNQMANEAYDYLLSYLVKTGKDPEQFFIDIGAGEHYNFQGPRMIIWDDFARKAELDETYIRGKLDPVSLEYQNFQNKITPVGGNM